MCSWQRGQDRFVLDRADAISSTNLWLIQHISFHLPHHTPISVYVFLSFSCPFSVCPVPFLLETRDPLYFFINSVLTPTLMPWANTVRMWTGGGWSLGGCRKGGRVAEASLVFEVIEEREEVLRVDSHFPEMSTWMTTPTEFNTT